MYPLFHTTRKGVRKELAGGVAVDALNGQAANGDGGNSALWFAAQGLAKNGVAVCQVLIDAGVVVNKQCEHGRTALHMAAAWGHVDVVKFLMDHGADPTIRDVENMTPAMVAINGYSTNPVPYDDRLEVRQYFESLDGEP